MKIDILFSRASQKHGLDLLMRREYRRGMDAITTIELTTVDEVIDTLGGTSAVATLTDRSMPAVSMWRARGNFPPETYVILTESLRNIGKTAPLALWSMMEARERGVA